MRDRKSVPDGRRFRKKKDREVGAYTPSVGEDRAALEERIRLYLESGQLALAATEALKGYGPEILGYLVTVLKDRSSARDVFADFAEDMWKGIPRFRRESSFRTWAYKLAWNAAQMFWRDPFRKRVRRLTTSEYSRVAERLRVSSVRQDARTAADGLAKLRESLKPEEQTLLVLRVDKGLSWNEIALVLAGSEETPPDVGTLRKRFERLKERLLRLAKKEGLLESPR